MVIKPEEITGILQKQIAEYETKLELKEVGYVIQVGDGIARIFGLHNAVIGELLEFPHNVFGMVLNLERENVGCILFGADHLIKEGDEVKRTGKVLEVSTGKHLLGRVVNPLGIPIDGKGD
ncbi:MAG: F0F1 ATP synthase subunit alpha, partial [Elusimicrobiota bacterium]